KHNSVEADDDAKKDAEATASVKSPPATIAAALDRIQIPQNAKDRIAELTWAGASVLISDRAMSGETGLYTDFIVLTRAKPAPRHKKHRRRRRRH
ncbi:MAG: hypothetical protein P8Y36_08150, partial [Alphaproteobacteria bacterium]